MPLCRLSIINQSNPVLLKERVRIPRTRRAGGAAMLWRRLPLDGVGSCRLFFTDDLHDNLSWVPASDKPHTFKSCFTHSSQVFFGRPGPFLPWTGLDLTLFISPLERMTCPNHLSRRSRTRMARSHIPSLACSSSIDGSSDGLTPQIQRIIARSLRHSRWRAAEVMGQVSIPCNIELRTLELNRRPLRSKGTGLDVSSQEYGQYTAKNTETIFIEIGGHLGSAVICRIISTWKFQYLIPMASQARGGRAGWNTVGTGYSWWCLTHWGREKWTPFSRRHFQMHFLQWKCMGFY